MSTPTCRFLATAIASLSPACDRLNANPERASGGGLGLRRARQRRLAVAAGHRHDVTTRDFQVSPQQQPQQEFLPHTQLAHPVAYVGRRRRFHHREVLQPQVPEMHLALRQFGRRAQRQANAFDGRKFHHRHPKALIPATPNAPMLRARPQSSGRIPPSAITGSGERLTTRSKSSQPIGDASG